MSRCRGCGDFNGDADRNLTGLDGAQQPMFAVLQQSKDGLDVFDGQAGLLRDRCVVIAAPLQTLDVVKQVDGAVLAASQILHQAHDQAVFGIGLDDDRRDLLLAKRLIGLKSALAADEIVSRTVRIVPTGDGDRPSSGRVRRCSIRSP